jgi:ribonucleoside-diphosphate reductase alpha chain
VTKINELGQQILKTKYYAAGETSPEDVFMRVAKVVAIPDVLYEFQGFKSILQYCGPKPGEAEVHILDVFDPYQKTAERVILREIRERGVEHFWVNKEDQNRLLKCWEKHYTTYFNLMNELKFMPATPVLINAGHSDMLSSCFFMDIQDSIEDIFDVMKKAAIVMKQGGGVGFDFSNIRPEGSLVSSSGKNSSTGPISYMKIYNSMGDQISQGSIRKSAMMACLSVDHPDIERFITCKQTEGDLSNFNISVITTKDFMDAVNTGSKFLLKHPRSSVTKTVDAKGLWDKIMYNAHKNGEPGIQFGDHIDAGDVYKGKYGKLRSNPCSELFLLDRESCALACINLSEMYVPSFNTVDPYELRSLVRTGIRFLDNMVSINNYPLEDTEKAAMATRRIGLGVTGLHDLLLASKINYASEDGIDMAKMLFRIISEDAQKESEKLAKERGVPEYNNCLNRRNGGLLTCQPAGTVSMIMNQVSSGIEPVYQFSYPRKDSYGSRVIKHWILEEFEDLPSYAKSALDISLEWHVRMQSEIQKFVDASISKTVNLPNNATVDDVKRVYELAYKFGCKSVTVYRSGSREKEVLVKEEPNETTKKAMEDTRKGELKEVAVENIVNDLEEKEEKTSDSTRERPRVLFGSTFKVSTPSGTAYITINEDKEGVREVFIHVNKSGTEIASHVEAHGRLISNALKYRVPIESMISHLKGHKSSPVFQAGGMIKSLVDGVAIILSEYIDNFEGFSQFIQDPRQESYKIDLEPPKKSIFTGQFSGEICSECGEMTVYAESGCKTCKNCGKSMCS